MMRKKIRIIIIAVQIIAIVFALSACAKQEEPVNAIPIAEGPIRLKSNSSIPTFPSTPANIKGRIIRLDRTSSDYGIFQIVVEADPYDEEAADETEEIRYDVVRVYIEEHTFLGDDSDNPKTVAATSFFTGREVEVWFNGEPTTVADIVQFEGQAVKVLSVDSGVDVFGGSYPWMAATSGGTSVLSVIYGVQWDGEAHSRDFHAPIDRKGGPVLNAPSGGSVSLTFSTPPEWIWVYYNTTDMAEERIPIEAPENVIIFKDLSIDMDPSGAPVTVCFLIDAYYSNENFVQYAFSVQVSTEEAPS